MAAVNYALREISCKIVYYGPGLCGKTTNLQHVHQHIMSQDTSNLISLATPGERTLFFDFLPLEAPKIQGFRTKFQLYTVPGQVMYNATRRLVLRGADGVVFVCDSQWDKMKENVESVRNLEENLSAHKAGLDQIPYVIQYNKRDLPRVAPLPYLEYAVNRRGAPSFEAVAVDGRGVFETLNTICRFVLHNVESKQQAGAL
jgi:signal recognition particle receptor subunit beta